MCLRHGQWEPASVAFQQALRAQADHAEAIDGLTLALRKRAETDADSGQGNRRLTKAQADALREDLLRAAHSGNPELAMQAAVIAALGMDGQAPEEETAVPSAAPPGVPPPGASAPAGPAGSSAARGFAMLAPLADLSEPSMQAGSGLFASFPLLRDAVTVAKVTLGLYKNTRKN
jgi:hypothetical protein